MFMCPTYDCPILLRRSTDNYVVCTHKRNRRYIRVNIPTSFSYEVGVYIEVPRIADLKPDTLVPGTRTRGLRT